MTTGPHEPYDISRASGQSYASRARRGPSWFVMAGLWAAVFALVWSSIRRPDGADLLDPAYEARAVSPAGDLRPEELATIDVFRRVSPAVVHITSVEVRQALFSLDIFAIPRGTGSGFIYDGDGHVVTNFHVIQQGERWRVRLADGSEYDAKHVGSEPDKDLAVLKIDAPSEKLAPIALGSSGDLQVGQTVLAIGNPFGLDQTLTVGVVSALGREIQSVTGRAIEGVIQTDAAINPGNSGGPLLDSGGRLIGVNTQIASPSGASAGIGFAVPVDTVNEIVTDLIRYGVWRRPGLGIEPWEDWRVRRLGLSGVLIRAVSPESSAAKAGLRGTIIEPSGGVRQVGDLIIKINDAPVRSLIELLDELDRYKVGDVVQVALLREDKVLTVPVELQYVR